jgi:hypothetical protein
MLPPLMNALTPSGTGMSQIALPVERISWNWLSVSSCLKKSPRGWRAGAG